MGVMQFHDHMRLQRVQAAHSRQQDTHLPGRGDRRLPLPPTDDRGEDSVDSAEKPRVERGDGSAFKDSGAPTKPSDALLSTVCSAPAGGRAYLGDGRCKKQNIWLGRASNLQAQGLGHARHALTVALKLRDATSDSSQPAVAADVRTVD